MPDSSVIFFTEKAHTCTICAKSCSQTKGKVSGAEPSTRERNGNLYPTHGLGPVANYMGINRGDRFDYLVSMSTPQRGLDVYRSAHLEKGDPRWAERYITGDMNTSLIKTANGLTITLKHDVSNPRPYDRINTIAGTKGIFTDYPPRIYLDGQQGRGGLGNVRCLQGI